MGSVEVSVATEVGTKPVVYTLTTCPAISIPGGFTAEGLPVGLQMVGRPQGEASLLMHASLFESEAKLDEIEPLPIEPK